MGGWMGGWLRRLTKSSSPLNSWSVRDMVNPLEVSVAPLLDSFLMMESCVVPKSPPSLALERRWIT